MPTFEVAKALACAVCQRPAARGRKGMCEAHYFRLYRTGSVGSKEVHLKKAPGTPCAAPGCKATPKRTTLCAKHAARMRRHGDFDTVNKPDPRFGANNPTWIGDTASYRTMHNRIKYAKGPAASHPCSRGCGSQGHEWAYDHKDPDEKICLTGEATGCLFSTKIEHYVPMCRSCHRTHDRGALTADRRAANRALQRLVDAHESEYASYLVEEFSKGLPE